MTKAQFIYVWRSFDFKAVDWWWRPFGFVGFLWIAFLCLIDLHASNDLKEPSCMLCGKKL